MNLSYLNLAQRDAVINTQGPCMIVAGAGSGKTSVLTHRISYLLKEQQVAPQQILALTFTNKAAKEMQDRIEKLTGGSFQGIWIGTFHSIFARILRYEAAHIGFHPNFSIYDTDDSNMLIKTLVNEMGLDDKIYKPGVVLARISGAKNRLITAQAYAQSTDLQAEDQRSAKPQVGEIFLRYSQRCIQGNAMDFDDLLLNTYQLLQHEPVLRKKYQEQFHYILVDEFQDTNLVQYSIIKLLTPPQNSICVVGDDAQSIYAFRGASIQNILSFSKDYPNLKTFKLEQNYRSTPQIVKAANAIIGNNQVKIKKDVWTQNTDGSPIEIFMSTSDNEEGQRVAYSIFKNKQQHQLENNDFAVLYRTNSQSRIIEEALHKQGIPYRLVGGISFYMRKEVKDLLAYLRLLVNPHDESAIKRVINLPKRGIGSGSILKLTEIAYNKGVSLWTILSEVDQVLQGGAARSINEFVQLIQETRQLEGDAYTLALSIAQRSGLLKDLCDDQTPEGLVRYQNTHELLSAIKVFTKDPENTTAGLDVFIQQVALATSADDKEDNKPKVTLMTVHAAKGLEFAYVYVIGLEEDLFPSSMMLSTREDLEEERRLFYVALTRAKHQVFLSYALTRYMFGRIYHKQPSRFIKELPIEYLREADSLPTTASTQHNYTTQYNYTTQHNYTKQLIYRNTEPKLTTSYTTKGFNRIDIKDIKIGLRVEHPQFGCGVVQEISPRDAAQKIKVVFNKQGEKTLLLQFAKLKILHAI